MQHKSDELIEDQTAELNNGFYSRPVAIENYWLQLSLLTISYITLALLGSLLSSDNAYTVPLWPAAGLALAGILMCGNRCWPGIWLGALIADLILQPASTELLLAAIIATGITLQAVLGATLTRHYLLTKLPLSRENDITGFLLIVGPLACLLSASLGTFALYLICDLPDSEITSQWLIWWSSNTVGVLLITPLILLAWPGTNAFWPKSTNRVIVPLLITAVLLAAGNMVFHSLEKTRAMDFTDKQMNDFHLSSFYHLPDVIEPLRGVERFFSASEQVTRAEFATYSDYFHHHPAILSVDWAPRLSAEKVPAFIAALNSDGFSRDQIFELNPTGTPVPAELSDEYFPVLYSEPIERNRSVLGLNHGFELPRVIAMEKARDTGEFSSTAVIPLLRTDIRAVLTFMAVYQNRKEGHNMPLAMRRESLRGFVVGVLDIEKLFASLVQTTQQHQLLYRVTDITPGEPAQIIDNTIPDGVSAEWSWQEQFANRTWKLEMQPIHPPWQAWVSFESRFYLGFSMLAAFLVAFSTLSGAGRQAATSLEVDLRTAELQRELHARAIAEAALRLSEQDLNITLHSIGDGVLATDAKRCITRLNPVAEKLTGWTIDDARGRPVEDVFNIINEETRLPGLIPVDDVLNSGEVHGLANHTVLIARDGTEYHIADSAAPIRDGNGLIRGVVLVFRDVGEEREITHQIEQARTDAEKAKKEAEQASRAKSTFLATMSHEIRTPMNGVIGLIDVLSHSQLSVHQIDLVTTIRQSAKTLLTIIDDILDFSKIEAGKLNIEHLPVSINDLVEALCNSLIPVASHKGVDLSLFISPEIPELVLSDDVRLRQLLYNLIGNAIKFSSGDAGKRGQVSIRVTTQSEKPLRLSFSIADNGIGMTQETISHLFTPFNQAEASTTRRFGGSGLGLTICKRLVDLMHGEISAQSNPGEGSIFTLILPVDISKQQPAVSQPDLTGLDCIIVDSNEYHAEDLKAYLEYAGADVKLAADVTTAINSLDELNTPVVMIQHKGNDRPLLNSDFDELDDIRHLLITHGRRRRARVESSKVISLDGNALRRQALIRAVAVAAGRASPEIFQQIAEFKLAEDVTQPPSIDEARDAGRLILIAEDDEINQKVILQQLALLGHAGEIANNGIEALQMWQQGKYAMLFTDLHMPKMDGHTLAEKIRQQEAGQQHIPIIIFTANVLHDEAENGNSLYIDDYLPKPVQLQLLRAMLEKWLPSAEKTTRLSRTSEASNRSADKVLDLEVLKSLVGNNTETVREFLSSYLKNTQSYANDIETGFTAGDYKSLMAIAHKLKSSSRAVGALAIANICENLEAAASSNDKKGVSDAISCFESAHAAVTEEITRLLNV